jgi:hypothetical protein
LRRICAVFIHHSKGIIHPAIISSIVVLPQSRSTPVH